MQSPRFDWCAATPMFIFAVMSYFRPLAAALVYAISYGVQSVGLPRCTADPPEAKQLSRARLHTFGAPYPSPSRCPSALLDSDRPGAVAPSFPWLCPPADLCHDDPHRHLCHRHLWQGTSVMSAIDILHRIMLTAILKCTNALFDKRCALGCWDGIRRSHRNCPDT